MGTAEPDYLAGIWRRLERGTSPGDAMTALCGIPPMEVADLAVVVAAASADADQLLAATPEVLTRLRSGTTTVPERCQGHIQGPVMWAETFNARANMLGAEDLYVCGVQRRHYDVAENQVLLGALDMVVSASRYLDGDASGRAPRRLRDTARRNVARARQLRDDPHLHGVRRRKTPRSTLLRTRLSRHGRDYSAAVAMLERRRLPFRAEDLALVVDRRTAGQLRALALVHEALVRAGHEPGPYRCIDGEVHAGGLRYRNWRNVTPQGNHGILVGSVLVDGTATADQDERVRVLEALSARAGRRRASLVTDAHEADLVVGLEAATTPA